MALTLVQSNGAANTGTSGTIAFSSNVTLGNLLLVYFPVYNNITNAPTDSRSNTWYNILASTTSGSGSSRLGIWAAVANFTGSCTVSYSGFPSANEAGICLQEWSGVQAISFAGFASYGGTSTIGVNNATPLTTLSGTAVLLGFNISNTGAITPSPGTSRVAFSLSTGAYIMLADTPFTAQSSFENFSITWSTPASSLGLVAMLFLSPTPTASAGPNSSFAS